MFSRISVIFNRESHDSAESEQNACRPLYAPYMLMLSSLCYSRSQNNLNTVYCNYKEITVKLPSVICFIACLMQVFILKCLFETLKRHVIFKIVTVIKSTSASNLNNTITVKLHRNYTVVIITLRQHCFDFYCIYKSMVISAFTYHIACTLYVLCSICYLQNFHSMVYLHFPTQLYMHPICSCYHHYPIYKSNTYINILQV